MFRNRGPCADDTATASIVMVRRRPLLLGLTAIAGAGLSIPSSAAAAQWSSKGVIRKIADDRSSVAIAHEAIDGYMGAMTMSFEPRRTEQLHDLAVGDRVRFTFTETDEGRRLLDTITAA